ncbi:guanylate kinase [Thermosulfuriphilus ammonigenes]|nr:guanylate kinase [Thermosulfuriphilus ammonigenes]MBA2847821.1 guanylate kinase [Thermosulfuriphilus ammonigenes]
MVISAPSGAGKTTLIRQLLRLEKNLIFSVSHTTRSPRPGEVEGKDYYFVSREEFESLVAAGAFLEWAEVHGNLYGTSMEKIREHLDSGRDVVLDIDVQGARQVRKKMGLEAALIFILPPSWSELERRLRSRGTEDEASLRRRLDAARQEIQAASEFDYLVLNDRFDRALSALRSILTAERLRSFRHSDLLRQWLT